MRQNPGSRAREDYNRDGNRIEPEPNNSVEPSFVKEPNRTRTQTQKTEMNQNRTEPFQPLEPETNQNLR